MSLMQLAHLTFKLTTYNSSKNYMYLLYQNELKESWLVSDQIALVEETGDKIIYDWHEIDQVFLISRKLRA